MDNWTNINDRRPDEYSKVIVAFTYDLPMKYRNPFAHKKNMRTTSAYVDKYGKFHLDEKDNFYENVDIKYWMPYPQPPIDER